MSIKLRLALLLGLLLLVFLFGLVALHTMERRQTADTLEAARREDSGIVANWLEIRSASLRRFMEDLALWPGLADAVRGDSAAREKLLSQLPVYGADAVWLASARGETLHAARRHDLPALDLPLPTEARARLAAHQAGRHSYFHVTDAGLAEVHAFRLDGPETPWVFVARIWDKAYLDRLGELTEGEARLAPPAAAGIAVSLHESAVADDAPAPIAVQRTLPGWDGEPVRTLRVLRRAPDISFREDTSRLNARVYLVFGLCLIASLALSLHQWVLRPLGWITDSLSRQDTAPIQPLIRSRTELTRVARLIVTSFEHREQLRREVAERRHAELALKKTLEENARLGRDLHDGVIQSIYAAGMGIAAARKRVADDPAAVERHLAQVASTLNETIRDVRNFITGLESEDHGARDFAESVSGLFATMNGDGAARADIHVDENVAARLPTSLRTDLLLLLREAISNALRHGHAGLVRIRLVADDSDPRLTRLEIHDDGLGFEPHAVKRGRGLDNLFARAAAHGAAARLDSAPGRGTRLSFTWTLPHDEEGDEEDPPATQAPA